MKTFTLILFFLPLFCSAQLTISPIVGVEMNTFGGKVSKEYYSYYYTTFWESRGLLLGISASHPLTEKLDLEFTTCFTKNRELIRYRSLVLYSFGIDYSTVFNSISIKRELGKFFRVSAGLGLNLYFNIKNYFPIDEEANGEIIRSRFFDFGFPIGLEVHKYGIVFSLTYFQGIKSHYTFRYNSIPPIQNFLIGLGYEIKI